MEQLIAYDCHQNVTEPQATEYHKKSTHMYTNCEWIYKACCTQADPAHDAGGNGMDRWQHSGNFFFFFFYMRYWLPLSCYSQKHSTYVMQKRYMESSDFNTGTV